VSSSVQDAGAAGIGVGTGEGDGTGVGVGPPELAVVLFPPHPRIPHSNTIEIAMRVCTPFFIFMTDLL
jgi:hypothetical protein